MARYGLENDKIRIEIDSHGAELKSLVKKETGTEYMWCADPGAPFVCIEPWYGRSDRIGYEGELRDREYENVIAAGATWEAGYAILV